MAEKSKLIPLARMPVVGPNQDGQQIIFHLVANDGTTYPFIISQQGAAEIADKLIAAKRKGFVPPKPFVPYERLTGRVMKATSVHTGATLDEVVLMFDSGQGYERGVSIPPEECVEFANKLLQTHAEWRKLVETKGAAN
jgi:hypothetical protein